MADILTAREREPDVGIMSRFDFLLRMTSPEIADAYVKRVIEDASLEDRARLRDLVMHVDDALKRMSDDARRSWRDRPESGKRQKGGGGELLRKLLQLAEAIHDFADDHTKLSYIEAKALRTYMMKSIGLSDLPFVTKSMRLHSGRDKLFVAQLTFEEIADKSTFVKYVTQSATLRFGNTVIDNSRLLDKNFEDGVYTHKEGTVIVDSGPDFNGDFRHFEMFCLGTESILDLECVVRLRDTIRAAFKNDKFMVDQNALPGHPGLERPLPFIVAFVLGFENTIAAIMKYHKVRWTAVSATCADYCFMEQYSCDASVHDGATYLGVIVPNRPTGRVLDEGPVRIEFDGNPTRSSYGLKIDVDPSVPVDLADPASGRTSAYLDVSVDGDGFRTATDRETGVTTSAGYGKVDMSKIVRLWHKTNVPSCATPLALKLVGDWGQIEHCKTHDIVFVTCDKLACLYAIYRGVSVMYLNHHDSVQYGKHNGAQSSFVQYSFVMWNGGGRVMQGGSSNSWLNAALVAVLVAGAVIASL
jgi:hypothetical protein